MKNKIVDIIVDILLITGVFVLTDIIIWKVFQSESIWLELGTYIVLYAAVFGVKSGIAYLWKNRK